ncbi:MAG: carbamoyltransferase HypF [Candidatus Lustribacter sp.]|jgi:hydrogenase maturation protein HypF
MSAAAKSGRRTAVRLRITGVVQGVGFRPFVYRLAQEHGITGWVRNAGDGVHVAAEGREDALARFAGALRRNPPPAARIAGIEVEPAEPEGFRGFEIRASTVTARPTARVSPDLATCADCLRELFDRDDRRFGYPYINCTNCGPRYSIIYELPYDRARTVMRAWPLCAACRAEYEDPANRRFHAEPVACPECGPHVHLEFEGRSVPEPEAVARAAALLARGAIVAIKGIGGYHLACDAENADAVAALRERKYRKERPFAVMARDLDVARTLVEPDARAEGALTSIERPIVLARARRTLAGVAPDNADLGVLLPYAPIHHVLFAAGAPAVLVMTSANRSSEPIAYDDAGARASLAGIADAFLVGERPIVRRIDDSVVRMSSAGRAVLRRSRGLAPAAVATLPAGLPILALGGDLKNALTLVVAGQAFGGGHVGDLDHLPAFEAFEAGVRDLCAMYEVRLDDALVVHDMHPGYRSAEFAQSLPGPRFAVQHHRAHVASVLAERAAWEVPAIGFAFDGTGYGDDGTIWGGEVFAGSLAGGLQRVAHLRSALQPGGDAAARFPVQAAAGFLHELDVSTRFEDAPFNFPERFGRARELVAKRVRAFETTSIGRLFDTVAALAGFTREQSFEGQAAMWLEHLARSSGDVPAYAFPYAGDELDFRPLLAAVVADRIAGRPAGEIARAFHAAVANAVVSVAEQIAVERVVVSGGVFQNALLLELLTAQLGERLWFNTTVPANDGGLSLGQAAYAAFHGSKRSSTSQSASSSIS